MLWQMFFKLDFQRMRPVPAEKNISKDYSFKLKLRQFESLA